MNDITVNGLSFRYADSDQLILQDVNMRVREGDFVCLLGQSGCGKSTFLRLMAGLEAPSSGSICVDGQPIDGTSLERSVVFQDYGLFPWMSAGENIVLALRQRFPEKSKAECRGIARRALREVGLKDEVFGKYPKSLSGGMKQRCAIARSFSMNPPILLMDEPFGALDAVTRARLQDMVLDLWSHEERKKTVFFVTHDVEEALLPGNGDPVLRACRRRQWCGASARGPTLAHERGGAMAGDGAEQRRRFLRVDAFAATHPFAVKVQRRGADKVQHQLLSVGVHPCKRILPSGLIAHHLLTIDMVAKVVGSGRTDKLLNGRSLPGKEQKETLRMAVKVFWLVGSGFVIIEKVVHNFIHHAVVQRFDRFEVQIERLAVDAGALG